VRILVSNRLDIYDVTEEQRQRLAEEWSVDNPAYISAVKRGGWVSRHTPKRLYAAVLWPDGHVELPRGLLGQVSALYPDVVPTYAFSEDGVLPSPPPALIGCTLRNYQHFAVNDLCEFIDGVLVGPCGSGKTTMGLEVIRHFGVRTLVLVHTNALLDQWNGAIKALLGEWGVANVTVCTVQSLWATESRPAKPLPSHGMLMVDECHTAPSRCFSELVSRSKARFRYGLTATPDRDDGLDLTWQFGPIRHTVDRVEIKEAGHTVTPRYEVMKTGCSPNVPTRWNRVERKPQLDFTALVSLLANDDSRTDLVAGLALREANAGHVVMVLTTRVEHAEAIADRLFVDGDEVAHIVHGKVKGAERERRLEDVREGRVRILIATQLADMGLDLPVLDRLILALPGKSEGRTIQRVGRIMRPAPGKGQPVVYDIVDNLGVCWAQQKARKRAFDKACGVVK
jgi:superfamily II DNA or RNA helicase